jgi:hypothetical protein
VHCASAGAERRGGVLCADPAYVVIPQEETKKANGIRIQANGSPRNRGFGSGACISSYTRALGPSPVVLMCSVLKTCARRRAFACATI